MRSSSRDAPSGAAAALECDRPKPPSCATTVWLHRPARPHRAAWGPGKARPAPSRHFRGVPLIPSKRRLGTTSVASRVALPSGRLSVHLGAPFFPQAPAGGRQEASPDSPGLHALHYLRVTKRRSWEGKATAISLVAQRFVLWLQDSLLQARYQSNAAIHITRDS